MEDTLLKNISHVRIGLVLALLTIAFGFFLGGAFGLWEDSMKGHLEAQAQAADESVYEGDAAKMKTITDKSWVYLKRAHLHGGAVGGVALVIILLVAALPVHRCVKAMDALALGLGGLGYSVSWLLAGLRAPALGSTGLAKESLAWFARLSAALVLAGVCAAILLVVWCAFVKARRLPKPLND
ncbi:hypothetical protein LCGC14_0366670 [marine sediment metagenome]|uniref:Uncharacterized protein n=1 Tax=marine sediment metagenome TaxID=412755 RepID=A0A0F9T6G6_9ZZZZ|nr:hypothetical protein [Phycisphaerae bacterium]HDZ43180.1 hypothetical protein [Phycisphaerae bacterium]